MLPYLLIISKITRRWVANSTITAAGASFFLQSHFNSNGSYWTKKYKPLKVIEIIPNCDDYDEDKITMQYMDKYGINNVRGGSFVSVKLDKSTIDTLRKMSNGTNNKCFVCFRFIIWKIFY